MLLGLLLSILITGMKAQGNKEIDLLETILKKKKKKETESNFTFSNIILYLILPDFLVSSYKI